MWFGMVRGGGNGMVLGPLTQQARPVGTWPWEIRWTLGVVVWMFWALGVELGSLNFSRRHGRALKTSPKPLHQASSPTLKTPPQTPPTPPPQTLPIPQPKAIAPSRCLGTQGPWDSDRSPKGPQQKVLLCRALFGDGCCCCFDFWGHSTWPPKDCLGGPGRIPR